MKKHIFQFMAFTLLLTGILGFANCSKRQVPGMAEGTQKDTTVMHARINEPFVILLKAQMGTGFRWMIEGELPEGLTLMEKEQLTPEAEQENQEFQRFRFQANQKGRYSLTFLYRRPWEKQPSEKTEKATYLVLVE